jgi:diguanylate cyclase (GGDEF)-like protein
LIDIDDFKSINDTWGSRVGDIVLARVAAICRSKLRGCDHLGRIGCDQFAVMLPGLPLVQAFESMENLREALASAVVEVLGHKISVTVSIGIAEWPGAEWNIDLLLRNTEITLDDAKSNGHNRTACHFGDDLTWVYKTPAADPMPSQDTAVAEGS